MKPILFNNDMVRAILDRHKTVTRRVVKPQPIDGDDCKHEMQTYDKMLPQFYKGDYSCVCRKCGYGTMPSGKSWFQPPYCPGDILYVRETWTTWVEMRKAGATGHLEQFYYKADANAPDGIKWHPATHMPREVARIFLRVTDVRVERLRDIENGWRFEDEGIVLIHGMVSEAWRDFAKLWDSTIKKADLACYGWDANPWVWVIEFERISREEAFAP